MGVRIRCGLHRTLGIRFTESFDHKDFRILIGTTEISLSKYGTTSNVSIFASIPTSGGVSIAPDEVILVVDSDVTAANLNTIIGWGVPVGTKFFTSSESTLLGTTGDRLDDNRAFLKSGSYEWSHTDRPPLQPPE